jgi:type VI protein secretion system component Hcp
MASYIKFAEVDGPCEQHDHETWIQMESWNWSAAREMSGGNQVGWASGLAKFEVLEFSAPIGSATATMFMKMLSGKHFETVDIECTKNTGETNPEVWLRLNLHHVLVTSISQEIGEDEASDSIALTFSQCEMTIHDQAADGTLDASGVPFGYDVTVAKITS